MLHACHQRFDVTGNLENFCELNKARTCCQFAIMKFSIGQVGGIEDHYCTMFRLGWGTFRSHYENLRIACVTLCI